MADGEMGPTSAVGACGSIDEGTAPGAPGADPVDPERDISISPRSSALETICRETARKYSVDADLAALICEGASGWNPWQAEYDGMFYVSHVAPLVENRLLLNLSEARSRAFRWGLMGILGHRARLAGYEGPLAELLDPVVGLDLGCRLLGQMTTSLTEGVDPVKHWRSWQVRGG